MARHHRVHRLAPEPLAPLRLGPRERARGRPAGSRASHSVGELDQVLAGIARPPAAPPARPAPAAAAPPPSGERLELIARVVDVVLGLDAGALRAEDARERVAHRGRARVDDHQRAGGIGGDELEAIAHALARVGPAVLRARREHLVEPGRAPARREEDVQEAGARDLEALDGGASGEVGTMAATGAAARPGRASLPHWWRSRRVRPFRGTSQKMSPPAGTAALSASLSASVRRSVVCGRIVQLSGQPTPESAATHHDTPRVKRAKKNRSGMV